MHIVEVSDSSSERKESIERGREQKTGREKNFTTSLKEDEESSEPYVLTYWYAIKIWVARTMICHLKFIFIYSVARLIKKKCL